MDPILLKANISLEDINHLIHLGAHDMDIDLNKKEEIENQADRLSNSFLTVLTYHMNKGNTPNAAYTFQIAANFTNFTENYRQLFVENYKKDVLIGFGISAVWMGILNGLDAESGIMPNHPLKREIANCLRTISEILDNKG